MDAHVPPGWYRDPWHPAALRWWTGVEFSAFTVPYVVPAPLPVSSALPVSTASVVVGLSLLLLAALKLVPFPDSTFGAVSALAAGPLFYVAVAGLCAGAARRHGRAALGFSLRPADLGVGLGGYLACLATSVFFALTLAGFGVPIASNNPFGGSGAGPDLGFVPTPVLLAMTFVLVVVVAPVVEEVLLRGVLLRSLAVRMPAALAIAAQAVLFGSLHAELAYGAGNQGLVLMLSGTGAALGAVAHLSKRLGGAIVAHMIFNTVAFVIGAGSALGG